MDIEKTIKELSQNEKKLLLTLKKLKGKASPDKILEEGDLNSEVEIMNAASWLQSKKLVKIEDHISMVYSLGKEGKQFLKDGFPEKIALQMISKKGGKTPLNELSHVLNKQDIPVAIGWLKKKGWANIKKDKGDENNESSFMVSYIDYCHPVVAFGILRAGSRGSSRG